MRIVVSTNREVSAHPLGISILTVDEHGNVLDALPTGWGQVDSLIIGLTVLRNAHKYGVEVDHLYKDAFGCIYSGPWQYTLLGGIEFFCLYSSGDRKIGKVHSSDVGHIEEWIPAGSQKEDEIEVDWKAQEHQHATEHCTCATSQHTLFYKLHGCCEGCMFL